MALFAGWSIKRRGRRRVDRQLLEKPVLSPHVTNITTNPIPAGIIMIFHIKKTSFFFLSFSVLIVLEI